MGRNDTAQNLRLGQSNSPINRIIACLLQGIDEPFFIIPPYIVNVGRIHVLRECILHNPPGAVRRVGGVPLLSSAWMQRKSQLGVEG